MKLTNDLYPTPTYQINFLPWRAERRFVTFCRTSYLMLISIFTILIMSLIVRLTLAIQINQSVKNLEQQGIELSKQQTLFQEVTLQRQQLKQYELLQNRFLDNQQNNETLISALPMISQHIPDDSWLNRISFKNSQWKLDGFSYQIGDIEALLTELNTHKQFAGLVLERLIKKGSQSHQPAQIEPEPTTQNRPDTTQTPPILPAISAPIFVFSFIEMDLDEDKALGEAKENKTVEKHYAG